MLKLSFPNFRIIIFLLVFSKILVVSSAQNATTTSETEKQFVEWAGRQFANRMLWMTHQRRFVLPKGTILQITPKITVPVFRHAPYNGGFDSDVQASWTFYMKFDKLNMTSEDHPWPFDYPPFYPFGEMMRPQVSPKDKDKKKHKESSHKEKDPHHHPHTHHPIYNHYYEPKPFPNIKHVSDPEEAKKSLHTIRTQNLYPAFAGRRKPRSVMSLPPPESIAGGERAIIMPSLEGLMSSLGFPGRACLLRAICEVHEFPLGLGGYGLFGEMVTLFFSISESPYAESHMPEYLKAEQLGRQGDCSSYKKNCTKSIFMWEPKENFKDENNSL